MVKSLDLEKVVEFHGFIPDGKLVEYYSSAGIFILPSTSSSQEGFGMVLLEALACETPVITTDIVGVARNVQENNAGIVVRPKDIGALSNAIVKILGDKELAGEMGKRGRKLVKAKYSWERVGEEILQLYKELT